MVALCAVCACAQHVLCLRQYHPRSGRCSRCMVALCAVYTCAQRSLCPRQHHPRSRRCVRCMVALCAVYTCAQRSLCPRQHHPRSRRCVRCMVALYATPFIDFLSQRFLRRFFDCLFTIKFFIQNKRLVHMVAFSWNFVDIK